MTVTELLVWGIVAHLVGDWLLQNEWMAVNKIKIRSVAGPVHALIHFLLLLLVWGLPVAALTVAFLHWLIDLRFVLAWWRKTFRQTTEGDMGVHVAIWGDQVLHILVLAVVAAIWGHS